MISAGRHKAKAIEAALGRTNGGAPQVAVGFQIVDGPHAGELITWYGYFSELTQEATIKALRTCGWKSDSLANLVGVDENEVSLVVEHEKDEKGELRAKVRWVNSVGGIAMKNRMSQNEADAFAAQMMGLVLSQKQGAAPAGGMRPAGPGTARPGAPARPPAYAPAGATGTDDEIPF